MVTPDPVDPLGMDEVIAARHRWDEQIAADRARWDRIASDPLAPPPPEAERPADPDDLDLTRFDYLAEQTDKLTVADDMLPQPPQSPYWLPSGTP